MPHKLRGPRTGRCDHRSLVAADQGQALAAALREWARETHAADVHPVDVLDE
jgi:hypothetical protein